MPYAPYQVADTLIKIEEHSSSTESPVANSLRHAAKMTIFGPYAAAAAAAACGNGWMVGWMTGLHANHASIALTIASYLGSQPQVPIKAAVNVDELILSLTGAILMQEPKLLR